jgi:hypothetical protein
VTVEFEHLTTIAAPIEVVFDLSLDIDAHLASMADSGERAIGGTTSGLIGLGETVTWRARHFGIPFTMTSKVTEWERPTAPSTSRPEARSDRSTTGTASMRPRARPS